MPPLRLPWHEANLQHENKNTKEHDKKDWKQKKVNNVRKFTPLRQSEFYVLTGITGFQTGGQTAIHVHFLTVVLCL